MKLEEVKGKIKDINRQMWLHGIPSLSKLDKVALFNSVMTFIFLFILRESLLQPRLDTTSVYRECLDSMLGLITSLKQWRGLKLGLPAF